jgi:hypothetical protein
MKYVKILFLFILTILLLSSCKLIDGWTHFEISYSSAVTLPQDLEVNQSKDVYPDEIEADLEGEVESEGYNPDKIESVELTDLKLTIIAPSGVDFSFLTSAELFMSAGDISELKVAWKDEVPAGVGNTLDMKTTSKDLKKFLKEEVVTLRLNIFTNTGIASDYYIGIDTKFLVDVKILGI